MKTKSKFWRLLSDYEKLATDEGVALREVNLAALAKLQSQKKTIGDAILELATPGPTGDTPPAEVIERVLAKQRENLALAQLQLASMNCERQNLSVASQRLSHVARAYQPETQSQPAGFSALG